MGKEVGIVSTDRDLARGLMEFADLRNTAGKDPCQEERDKRNVQSNFHHISMEHPAKGD
jgi:hypothetical protein